MGSDFKCDILEDGVILREAGEVVKFTFTSI